MQISNVLAGHADPAASGKQGGILRTLQEAAAKPVTLLHQSDREALYRQIGGCLNAGDATPDHQCGAGHRRLALVQRLEVAGPCDTHSDEGPRLILGLLPDMGVH